MRRLRVAWLPDGKRLHLRNGPVNVIIQAFGRPGDIGRAYDAAIERARGLVLELAEDLPRLQLGEAPYSPAAQQAVAASLAVPGHNPPVVALAGAVADEVLGAMRQGGNLERGFANNHGVVALHLAEGQSITTDALDRPDYRRYDSHVPIRSSYLTRGLAGSGWRHDDYALGCVDRIFIGAASAAVASAALGAVAGCMVPAGAQGRPASTLEPHSLLGETTLYPAMPEMSAELAAALLASGQARAEALYKAGVITLALLGLAGAYYLAAPPYVTLPAVLGLDS